MKKVTFGALALTALVAATSPAIAKHHHGKHHGTKTQEAGKTQPTGDAATADLNAKSLQQAQTPVPSAAPAIPAGTTLPANAPSAPQQ